MHTQVFHQLKKGKGDQQLILFPYLGGHADSFSVLANSIREEIEIWSSNLPGHGRCTQGELLEDINSVVNLYVKKIQKICKPNCIYFGHSMGGIIAYFLAQHILSAEDNLVKPAAIILSACRTPAEFNRLNVPKLADGDLLAKLINYGGMSDEILKERSLLDYLMPIFRADFKILESSSLCSVSPLNIPVYFLWGENDKIVPIESVIKWSKYFSSEINLFPIRNVAHMFTQNQLKEVTHLIENIIDMSRVSAPVT